MPPTYLIVVLIIKSGVLSLVHKTSRDFASISLTTSIPLPLNSKCPYLPLAHQGHSLFWTFQSVGCPAQKSLLHGEGRNLCPTPHHSDISLNITECGTFRTPRTLGTVSRNVNPWQRA